MPASANRSSRQFSRNHPRSSPNTSGRINLTPGRSVSRISMFSRPLRPAESLLSSGLPASAKPFAAVRAVLNSLPPVAVLEVPRHRGLQTGVKIHLRRPAQFVANARRVDGVAPIVTGAIGNVTDQRPSRPLARVALIEQIAQRVDAIEVGP